MSNRKQPVVALSETVAGALERGAPVVALESTVISHGLPVPLNFGTARACEEAIRHLRVVPATVGIIAGRPTVGLSEEELKVFASGHSPDEQPIEKVSLNNLAAVMATGAWGATTVAATLRIARLGGLRVFSTGGIGGVHRGAGTTFDVSADLTALASVQMICVCAGAKAVLDLPKTIEQLEMLGVPVIGYQTAEFPAFYSRTSGLPVNVTVETVEEAARIAALHWQAGGGAVLVCVPVPEEHEIPAERIEQACREALTQAEEQAVRGSATTPFLLAQMEKLTEGDTLAANRALLVQNAEVAARVALALAAVT